MSRTIRDKHNSKARDGKIWRDCGDKNCPWCRDNRENKKIKDSENFTIFTHIDYT